MSTRRPQFRFPSVVQLVFILLIIDNDMKPAVSPHCADGGVKCFFMTDVRGKVSFNDEGV